MRQQHLPYSSPNPCGHSALETGFGICVWGGGEGGAKVIIKHLEHIARTRTEVGVSLHVTGFGTASPPPQTHPNTHPHTHTYDGKQTTTRQQSGETRKLLRSCKASRDVFRSE